jgi:hypothetical protein
MSSPVFFVDPQNVLCGNAMMHRSIDTAPIPKIPLCHAHQNPPTRLLRHSKHKMSSAENFAGPPTMTKRDTKLSNFFLPKHGLIVGCYYDKMQVSCPYMIKHGWQRRRGWPLCPALFFLCCNDRD